MKYLLDTHTFLWSLFSPANLSPKANKLIVDSENEVYVSVITFWEISLKYNLGKLELNNIKPEDLPDLSEQSGFSIFNLDVKDVSSFHKFPKDFHKDPFDRLLIWQALKNNLTVISKDIRFREYEKYGLNVNW